MPLGAVAKKGEYSLDTAQTPENIDMPIKVSMFGGGSIDIGGIDIRDNSTRSYQVWSFIEYLITFRHKTISQEELLSAMWESDDIDSPANAIKNLAYRARNLIADFGVPFAKKIILFSDGSYQWNNSLLCEVDTEKMENFHKMAMDTACSLEYRIEKYTQAIDLYKGDFLPQSSHRAWVMPVASYYRTLYFKCVREALELLEEQGRFVEIEMICRRALILDHYEETVHKYLLISLIKQNKPSKAISHYKEIADLFWRELGVSPSPALRGAYRQITRSITNVETDLSVILQDIKEYDSSNSAFFCDYEIFKSIFQVKARESARSGQTVYVALFTLTDGQDNPLDDKARKMAMGTFFDEIRMSTRVCDIFSQFSPTQYVMILPADTREICESVVNRIASKYRSKCTAAANKVHTNIQLIKR